jgi:hypothetical protein
MMVDISNIKHALDTALKAADEAAQDYNQLLNDNMKQQFEISELKTEIGRLEALLADKKPESKCECECDYNCECCKCREEADEEHEPTLKDLYKLGKYLVDTVDEIESIHIRVVHSENVDTNDTE